MIEKGRSSSGGLYVSSPEEILRVLSELTGVPANLIKTGEKKGPRRTREMAAVLMYDGLDMSLTSTGSFLSGATGSGMRHAVKRGMRRLRSDEEFAHTFAAAEQLSNIAQRGG